MGTVAKETDENSKAIPKEELQALFGSSLGDGEDAMSKDLFQKLFCYVQVVKGMSLGDGMETTSCKAIRMLKLGEKLEVIAGPVADSCGVKRVQVQIVADGTEGWATMFGNAGTVFLKAQ